MFFVSLSAYAKMDYKFSGYTSLIGAYGEMNDRPGAFVDGRLRGQISYKAKDFQIGLQAEMENYYYVKEGYLFVQFPFIRFEAGRALNIAEKMHVQVPEASFTRFNNYSYVYHLIDNDRVAYLTSTSLNTDDRSQKISVISGQWKGFQVGASYAPGSLSGYDKEYDYRDEENNGEFEKSLALGAKFSQDWGYYKLALSGGYLQTDKANNLKIDLDGTKNGFKRREEFSAAVNFLAGNWNFGAAGRLINEIEPHSLDGRIYEGYVVSGGLGYTFLKYGVSLNYQRSAMEGLATDEEMDIVNIYQASFKYNPYKNLHFWISGGYLEMLDGGEIEENEVAGFFGIGGVTYLF
jgi:hypothetical protein